MRFVILLLVVALLTSLAIYAILNLDERVDVTLPWTALQNQPQIYLVLVALAVGMVFAGFLSVLDGTRMRLVNRRQRRELERLRSRIGAPLASPPAAPVEPGIAEKDPARAKADRIPPAGTSSMTDEEPPYGM